tara:strand:- start:1185 stop:2060 length:876 start_codon:yes stop_codon:yes gene_type:complete
MNKLYPDLEKFSNYINISASDLVEAYKIESHYHNLIKNEMDRTKRKEMYSEMYLKAHQIYNRNSVYMNSELFSRKALLFKKELEGKSILDVGCGKGAFLNTIKKSFKVKDLVGIDVSLPEKNKLNEMSGIEFIKDDVTSFDLKRKFDVVYSNHVIEHMSNQDFPIHLESIVKHLKKGGKLIINMPNRLFGPSDVSRIIDFSYTNKIRAKGSHFNEMTYSELIPKLKKLGFNNFRSPFPHTIIRHLIRGIRLNSEFMTYVEKSNIIMKLLHSIKINGRCRVNFEVSLISSLI